LETWLIDIGAKQSTKKPNIWLWLMPNWAAEIQLNREDMKVIWEVDQRKNICSFPYGLTRADVQAAIYEGP
tara:strand:- start:358 stop:570 length:213 start_codon:yes stop_codon:yes gene_type:complete